MTVGFAIHNSMTDHGGIIPAKQMHISQMGNLFLVAGDGHYCPRCQCWSTIIKSHDHIIFDGKAVAYVGDKLTCGAKIMPKQSHVVGDSQGRNYSSSSSFHATTIAKEQQKSHKTPMIQPSHESISMDNTMNWASQSSTSVLTEDDKLLTEEANQVFQRCFKQTVNPMTLEHRKLATEMYFKAINAQERGLSYIELVFKAGYKAWGILTSANISKKIASHEGKQAYYNLKNEERAKYFKMEKFKTIDARLGDTGQAAITGIQVAYKTKFEMLNAGM